MNLQGERLIAAAPEATWAALNEPETLKACIAGCETLERVADDEFLATMALRIGPVNARFKGRLKLENIVPMSSYTIVFRGRKYITAGVAERLAETLGGDADKLPHELLSERELQVFLRLARGETVGHIADGMSLSVKTVSTYRTRVMEKMALASNSDLTYYALKNGLIQ